MPLTSEDATELRARAIGHDESLARDLDRRCIATLTLREDDGRDSPAVIASDVDRAQPLDRDGSAGERDLADRGIELQSWGGSAVAGEVSPRPAQIELLPEPLGAQAEVPGAALQPGREPEPVEFVDGPRGEAVTAGLIAWEGLRVDQQDVQSGAGGPSRGRGTGGACPDDEHVRRCRHVRLFHGLGHGFSILPWFHGPATRPLAEGPHVV